jgi:hypothetical protein
MANYRFYFLGTDNHIIGVETNDFRDDAEAARFAMTLIAKNTRPNAVEIWDHDRRISRHSRSI